MSVPNDIPRSALHAAQQHRAVDPLSVPNNQWNVPAHAFHQGHGQQFGLLASQPADPPAVLSADFQQASQPVPATPRQALQQAATPPQAFQTHSVHAQNVESQSAQAQNQSQSTHAPIVQAHNAEAQSAPAQNVQHQRPSQSTELPPSAFVQAPEDEALTLRITKLAEFTNRTGPAFEQQVRIKQADNPEYAFLNNGHGSDFYQWCLFCAAHGHPHTQPLPEAWAGPLPAQAPTSQGIPGPAPVPQEVSSGFSQVLQLLQGSQESIKASSAWFMACALHAHGMADMMLQHLLQLRDFQHQLHVLYLMNDIFFAGTLEGHPVNTQMAAVFRNKVSPMMATAYRTAQCSQAAFGQLSSLLDLWTSRGVFDASLTDAVRTEMLSMGAPVPPPAPMVQAPVMPPFQQQPGFGPPPVASCSWPVSAPPAGPHQAFMQRPDSGSQAWGPAPVHPQVRPPVAPMEIIPEPQPYDILSFPAGLIPKLVKQSLKYEKEYTPLLQDDIENEPPPPQPVKDSYMQSRLDRFYAEVAQYQPGQTRAMYEDKLQSMGDGMLPAPPEMVRHDPLAVSAETNMRSDGTFGGPDVGRGGLGAHSSASNDDPFAAYRQQKSGRYHSTMASKSTNPRRPSRGH